jgi:hypothetical protein
MTKTLGERGFKLKRKRDGSFFHGIALKPPEMTKEEADARWWTRC